MLKSAHQRELSRICCAEIEVDGLGSYPHIPGGRPHGRLYVHSPGVATVLFGATTPEQLAENVRAAQPLDDDRLATLRAISE